MEHNDDYSTYKTENGKSHSGIDNSHRLHKIFQTEQFLSFNRVLLQVAQEISHAINNRVGIVQAYVHCSEDQDKLEDFLGRHEKPRKGQRDEHLEANFVKEDQRKSDHEESVAELDYVYVECCIAILISFVDIVEVARREILLQVEI